VITMDVQPFRDSLVGLLRELVDGPPGDTAFIVNPGDRGVLRSVAQLSAAQASARPGGRSSVAAHVQHLRYGFELLNRWARGENPFAEATYAKSWGMQQVTDAEWRDLRAALEREVRAWMTAISERQDWDSMTSSGAMSSVAHLAYHFGAIRQLAPAASGPPARD
jgi:hypothetical protein